MIGNYQSWFYRCGALLVHHLLRHPNEIENIKKDGLEAVREHSYKESAQYMLLVLETRKMEVLHPLCCTYNKAETTKTSFTYMTVNRTISK
ncbi:hypothetical protein [Bacillus cihuensis]|uniref:hypothetical protein n=1 Tax=Bacillus cihuensis TaxID=1208599 RepID=UPI000422132A|nr:hypothetical protein [Bacillus cihuensis]